MHTEKSPFRLFDSRTEATNLQRFTVPWLIATYALSYAKSIQIDHWKEMLIAIIDENQLMGEGVLCIAQSKIYSIVLLTLPKKVEAAAGIYFYLLCFSSP